MQCHNTIHPNSLLFKPIGQATTKCLTNAVTRQNL